MEDYKFDNIFREISHLRLLDHANVVSLFHVVKDKRKLLLIMEDAGKLSLAGLLRRTNTLPEAQARPLFRQLLQAVVHCHSRSICHRDIKLENILVDQDQRLRLIDFGFSAKCGQKLRTFCGTPPYMAPELASKVPYYGEPADMWALGVLLYLMLFGKFPFRATSEKELYRLIQQGRFEMGEGAS
jgi:serine/threonine protein kinase